MGRSRVRRRNASAWLAPVPALPAVVLKKTAQPRQTESQRPQSTASTIAQQDKVLTYSFDDDDLNSAEQEFLPDDAQLTLERMPVLFSVEEADVIMGEFCARLAIPVTTLLVVPEEVVDLSDDGLSRPSPSPSRLPFRGLWLTLALSLGPRRRWWSRRVVPSLLLLGLLLAILFPVLFVADEIGYYDVSSS